MCSMFDISEGSKKLNDNVREDRAGQDSNGYKYTRLMSDESIIKINKLFSQDFDALGYKKVIPAKGML